MPTKQPGKFTGTTTLDVEANSFPNENARNNVVAEAIERSWRRCLATGMESHSSSDQGTLTPQELAIRHEQNHFLLSHAQPEMEILCEQIANKRSIVILTDSEGVILKSLGDKYFLSEDQCLGLTPGVSWHEDFRGTNAIGTAIVENTAMTVRGAQHFKAYHHSLGCSAVPIIGARNELLGTLDISNDFNVPQQHNLALVKMSAQMIENRLFCASYQGDFTLHFHSRPEFVSTLWEGIAIFSAEGSLIAINRSGQFQLESIRQSLASSASIHFNEIFDMPLSLLHYHMASEDKSAFPLILNNGARVYAKIESSHKHQPFHPVGTNSIKRPSAATLDMLDTGDALMKQNIAQIKKVLSRDISILIQGETGAGKELFARAIHDATRLSTDPWVAVNCAALPEGLIEAELFGYEEGAFTGAKRKGSRGKIEESDGGTLFLDEIGDMPLPLQARLLRVLQERAVTPLGSTKSKSVNFSLISATNQKLREKVEAGEFRSDLYYRINGLSITLPPLRERSDFSSLIDIILNVEQAGKIEITPEVLTFFSAHPWPGNIRQLHNVLRTAIALADGTPISKQHLTQDFLDEMSLDKINLTDLEGVALENLTTQAIQIAMRDHSGNISAVARQLGISRNTLYRKLKLLGLA